MIASIWTVVILGSLCVRVQRDLLRCHVKTTNAAVLTDMDYRLVPPRTVGTPDHPSEACFRHVIVEFFTSG